MKRIVTTLLAASMLIAPVSIVPAASAQGYGRADQDRDRDRNNNGRGERWDHNRHNGYMWQGRWYYGPPPAAYYGRPGFSVGYHQWRRGERLPRLLPRPVPPSGLSRLSVTAPAARLSLRARRSRRHSAGRDCNRYHRVGDFEQRLNRIDRDAAFSPSSFFKRRVAFFDSDKFSMTTRGAGPSGVAKAPILE
jgi:Ni/Co efflux regulator RcnB